MTNENPKLPKVRSIMRAVDILNSFTDGHHYLTLSQVAKKTGLDPNTTRRILHTLVDADFIKYDSETSKYSVGTAIYLLYPSVDYASNFREIAAPILSKLSAKLQLTSFIWTYLKGQALCVDRVRGGESLYELPWTRIGTRVPLNSGAGPRLVMAHLPENLRRDALAKCTGRTTPLSRTDPDDLDRDSELIRKQGWELAVNDYFSGITGLGVPIFSAAGEFAGSLSVAAPTHRLLTDDPVPPQLNILLDAAAEIGFCLKTGVSRHSPSSLPTDVKIA